MNQILATGNNENDKSEKYEDYDRAREIDFSDSFQQDKKGPIDTKKIIVFFCVAIIVFGVIIAGVYGYKSYKGKKGNPINKPEVSIQQDDRSATISAKSEAGINKIIYYWDEEDKNELQINGKTSYEKIIDVPNGENILIVQVIDQNGQETEVSQNFVAEGDQEKPKIEKEVIEENGIKKVKITAKDDTAMKYITYKWNSEEETKIDVEDEGDTSIETKIEISKTGENILTITAVDTSDNIEKMEIPFKAVNNPVISVGKSGDKLIMKITHDIGFKKVEFSINGKIYTYDENFSGYDATQKVLEYTFTLQEGKNTVAIIATSMEDTEKTYTGQTTYTQE